MRKLVLFIHGAGEGAYDEDSLIAAALGHALGSQYEVRYPRMPNEGHPEYESWKSHLRSELTAASGEIILVGHSVGASVLLKFLSEEPIVQPVAGLILIAAPYWGVDDYWRWDEVQLPPDVATRLEKIPRIVFYHSRDDEIVPFAHLALYAAALPQAVIRGVNGRGHQFEHLSDIAEDVAESSSGQSGHYS